MLQQDKTVWATGLNSFGQLGDGSSGNKAESFIDVLLNGAEAVAAGGEHSLLLKGDGTCVRLNAPSLIQIGAYPPGAYPTQDR